MDVDLPFASTQRTIRFRATNATSLPVGRERRRSGIAGENARRLVLANVLDVEREPRTGDAVAAVLVAGILRSGADERDRGEIRRDSGRVHADDRVDRGAEPLEHAPGLGIDPGEVALGRNQEPALRPGRPAGRRRQAEQPLPAAGCRHDVDAPPVRGGPDESDLLAVRRPGGEAVAAVVVRRRTPVPSRFMLKIPAPSSCEGDPLSVGRERGRRRGKVAFRELLETLAGPP